MERSESHFGEKSKKVEKRETLGQDFPCINTDSCPPKQTMVVVPALVLYVVNFKSCSNPVFKHTQHDAFNKMVFTQECNRGNQLWPSRVCNLSSPLASSPTTPHMPPRVVLHSYEAILSLYIMLLPSGNVFPPLFHQGSHYLLTHSVEVALLWGGPKLTAVSQVCFWRFICYSTYLKTL